MNNSRLFTIFCLAFGNKFVSCHLDGAPKAACGSRTPEHASYEAQRTPAPYALDVRRLDSNGSTVDFEVWHQTQIEF